MLNDEGLELLKAARCEEARQRFEQAIKLKRDHAQAYNNLGVTYDALGRNTEAIEALKQAVHIKPDNAESYFNLGFIMAK